MEKYAEQLKDFFMPYILPALETFKAFNIWKKALLSTSILIGSPIACTIASYNLCKLIYPKSPTIDYEIHGDINSKEGIIFFLHGWPDFGYIWEHQVKHFVSKGYCCIVLEIPNFNISKPIQNPWGYDIPTIVNAFGETIHNILLKNNKLDSNTNIILTAHDWGSILYITINLCTLSNTKWYKIKYFKINFISCW